MTIDTSSIGIREWAGEQTAEIVWEHGTGDQRLRGWEREDGMRAIETNGDPAFEDDDGFSEMWADGDDVVWTKYVDVGPSLGDCDDEEDAVSLLDDCYTEVCRGTRYTITARMPQRGELCAMYAVCSGGDLQLIGASIPVPGRVQELVDRAWEMFCDGGPKAGNLTAGSGKHSHDVPSEIGATVLMRDGSHKGTEVTRTEGGFEWKSLDWDNTASSSRCVLVRLTGVDVNDVPWPFACDLESPDGLALIGCEPGDDVSGEVLWDSHVPAESTAHQKGDV